MPHRRIQLAVVAAAACLGLSVAAQAAGAPGSAGQADGREQRAAGAAIEVTDGPHERFRRSIEIHGLDLRYRELLAEAKRLGAAPEATLLDQQAAEAGELRAGIEALERGLRAAREQAGGGSFGSVAGVDMATLEAIAACESGGDPTAVNAAGYYGKYQFDLGTWQSVGGSGNPAEASEAEQDHRAALLYQQAGASPWPVCGA